LQKNLFSPPLTPACSLLSHPYPPPPNLLRPQPQRRVGLNRFAESPLEKAITLLFSSARYTKEFNTGHSTTSLRYPAHPHPKRVIVLPPRLTVPVQLRPLIGKQRHRHTPATFMCLSSMPPPLRPRAVHSTSGVKVKRAERFAWIAVVLISSRSSAFAIHSTLSVGPDSGPY